MADTLLPLTAAAVSTAAIMYPVDVARALKMSSAGGPAVSIADFYKSHGLKGFVSQGVIPELVKSSSMRVSKFFFFPQFCQLFWGKGPSKSTPLEKGLAGAVATVPEILMISPMEVAKIGLQLDRENKFKNNSTAFARHIYETKGLSGLYSGWAGMQWRQSFWTGTYFATLSSWKGLVEPPIRQAGGGDALANLTSGFLAGVFASIPNAPGDVVRSVVQKKLFQEPGRVAKGISLGGIMEHISVANEIIGARGITALYAGFGFKAMHLGGSGALMAMFVPIFSDMMGIKYSGV
jgi:solute carrier family 25 2-oxodicarboxylate transporter 21